MGAILFMLKHIQIDKPGGYKALRVMEAPSESPQKGECLVEIHYIGVNYADTIIREGYYAAAKGLYPLVPGFEFSGIVMKVNNQKSQFKLGDKVCGITRFGAYKSEICVGEHLIIPTPKGWTLAEAAGFLVPHLTAYYGLNHVAHAKHGEHVVIHSAAGGVGNAFMQQAHLLGCKTYGVVGSTAKVMVVQGKPEHLFVKSKTLWREIDSKAPKGFDIIFDANGVTTPREGLKRLRAGGRLIIYGFAELFPRGGGKPNWFKLVWGWLKIMRVNLLTLPSKNITIAGFNIVYLFEDKKLIQQALQDLLHLANLRKLRKPKVKIFDFGDVIDAHRYLESGKSIGRIVLKV